MNDEARLKDKLRAIEALFAGATTPGERGAAGAARQRILDRIAKLKSETPIEWEFRGLDRWTRRLFHALAKRYALETYRYRGQRRTTVVVRAPEPFLKEIFIPEFKRMSETLDEHLEELAKRVIAEVLGSEAPESDESEQLALLEDPEASGGGT